jgi:hypothetical protein
MEMLEQLPWLDGLHALSLAVALAACAGLRAWLPLLLAAGLSRLGYLELGESFAFIQSDKALIALAIATLLEMSADKFPAVDHALDAISTVARPAAGALLAASVLGTVTEPFTALALGLAVGAPSALAPHAAKSLFRAGATALTGGLANPVISLIEDVSTAVLFVVALLVPVLVVALLLLLVALFWRRHTRRQPAPA